MKTDFRKICLNTRSQETKNQAILFLILLAFLRRLGIMTMGRKIVGLINFVLGKLR